MQGVTLFVRLPLNREFPFQDWPVPTSNFLASFDRRFDILRGPEFWTWRKRGVLGMQVIPAGAKVLDLCCGEGFYDRMYFAERASRVDALDLDGNAINLAQALNRPPQSSLLQGRPSARQLPRYRI